MLYSAGQYEIKTEFEKNVENRKGYTLGEKHIYSSPTKTPGPADYFTSHKDLETSPSITFSKKYKEKEPERSPSPNQVPAFLLSIIPYSKIPFIKVRVFR